MVKGRFNGFLPSIIWTIVIVIVSVLPGNEVKPPTFLDFWNVDKLAHLVVYAIHSYLILVGFLLSYKTKKNDYVVRSFILSISLGVLLEVVQHFCTQDRHFDLADMLANGIGTIIGLLCFMQLHK